MERTTSWTSLLLLLPCLDKQVELTGIGTSNARHDQEYALFKQVTIDKIAKVSNNEITCDDEMQNM